MNEQSGMHKNRIVFALIALAVIAAAIIYAAVYTKAPTPQEEQQPSQPSPGAMSEEDILKSLQAPNASNTAAPVPLTPEQKKALGTLGTEASSTAKQSSNSKSEEEAILKTLQGN